MGTPPRMTRTSAAAAVCYALTNHGDWPWPDGGHHSAEVLRELHASGLAHFYGPDTVAGKMARGRGPALPADAMELACAWLPYRLQGIPPEPWPRRLAFDLVEWRQLARAYRAVAEVQPGGGGQ